MNDILHQLAPAEGLVSIITPAFNEAENLPSLFERLNKAFDNLDLPWEWVVVDDHSSDSTFAVVSNIAERNKFAHCIRLSRNFGFHVGLICGLKHAQGSSAIVMAADYQDPPEVIRQLIEKWRDGCHIVWAARLTIALAYATY